MKYLILLPVLLMPWLLAAQATEGEITFNETVQLKIELDDTDNSAEMRKMMPSSQSSATTLFFNENKSLYKNKEEGGSGTENISQEIGRAHV